MKKYLPLFLMVLLLCMLLTSASAAMLRLPDSSAVIETEAFAGDSAITAVMLPDSLTSIGQRAFAGCANLGAVYFPDTAVTIETDAFSECPGVTFYAPADSPAAAYAAANGIPLMASNASDFTFTTSGGASTITGYTGSDTAVVIPRTLGGYPVEAIGTRAFRDSSITSVVMPDTITTIGKEAFQICNSLTEVHLPAGLESIGDSAFQNCTKLTEILLPDGVKSIGASAFMACSGLQQIHLPEGLTQLGSYAFQNCTALVTASLPGSLTVLGDYTFSMCYSLSSVQLSGQLTTTGNYTFSDCTSLSAIDLPAGITAIGKGMFSNCVGLKSISLPAGVSTIGDSAFYQCTGLSAITLPQGVTSIGVLAFGYSGISSISLPQSLTTIGKSAFEDCKKLTAIALPAGVTVLSDMTFQNCSALTSVTLPQGLTSIGKQAFSMCSKLSAITIPDSVTTIGDSAFIYCSNLTTVRMPARLTSLGKSAFASCKLLVDITLPGTVTSIGNYAFCNCTSLNAIAIPSGVTSIEAYTFKNCRKLTSITIPPSVTSFGSDPFYSCYDLTISGALGSTAQLYAAANSIPFLPRILPNPATDAIPSQYYRITNAYEVDGTIYFEADLLSDYNGVVIPDPAYATKFFFMDGQGHVVQDPAVFGMLYTMHMYIQNENIIDTSIASMKQSAGIWSESALDFMTKKAAWSVVGGMAGKLAGNYLGGGATFVGVLKTIGESVIDDVKECKELSSWLEIAFIKELLAHLDRVADMSADLTLTDANGVYQYEPIQTKLTLFAHFKNTHKAAKDMCVPVVDEILANFQSDEEVAMYYLATMMSEAISSANPVLSLSMNLWNAAVTGNVSQMDVAKAIMGQIDFFSGLDVKACKDVIDCLAGLDKAFETALGISQTTAQSEESWLAPFYMTQEELMETQLYRDHVMMGK